MGIHQRLINTRNYFGKISFSPKSKTKKERKHFLISYIHISNSVDSLLWKKNCEIIEISKKNDENKEMLW